MKISVFIATSLDGFIARENGDVDWLSGPQTDINGEDFGFQDFMDSVDTIVMGRNTFEFVMASGEWFYGSKNFIVLTSRELQIPEKYPPTIEKFNGTPQELVEYISTKGAKHIYIDGGKTIQDFLKAGLIQQITITRIPILLGKGIALFGPVLEDTHLKHVITKTYDNGFVQNRYEVL